MTTPLLTGMRVVESSAFVAVPYAGLSLAQMGAEVIRIDRPTGGLDAGRWPLAPSGRSLFWAGLNKGKKSVAVDIATPEGRELAFRIATAPGPDAGLLLTNLPAKGWLDHATLSAARPDMISVTLKGDRAGRPAVDYTVNPALGVPEMTGPEGSEAPVAHAVPAWDLLAGQMVTTALLAAERHRLRTGAGQAVEIALKDVAAAALGHLGLIGDAAVNRRDRQKAGNALYGAYGQDFVCACGGRVMVIGLTGRQWKLLVDATESAAAMAELATQSGRDLRDEGARWELRHQITAILAPWFAARRIDDFAEFFDAKGLTWSRFQSLREALERDPDLGPENPVFTTMTQPGLGTFPVPGCPARFDGAARGAPAPAPELGAHTEEVLADVARLDGGEIARLFDAGIISEPGHGARTAA